MHIRTGTTLWHVALHGIQRGEAQLADGAVVRGYKHVFSVSIDSFDVLAELDHEPTNKLVLEDLARSLGIKRVHVLEPRAGSGEFERLLDDCLASHELCVIIARRPCILIVKRLRGMEAAGLEKKEGACPDC